MPKIAIVVDYEAVGGKGGELAAVMRAHAAATLKEEPGCLRFEVLVPIERSGTPVADTLMLTELYADEAAVTAHEANPRMPSVRAAAGPLIKAMKLTYAIVEGS